jgi:hypothetical protein
MYGRKTYMEYTLIGCLFVNKIGKMGKITKSVHHPSRLTTISRPGIIYFFEMQHKFFIRGM